MKACNMAAHVSEYGISVDIYAFHEPDAPEVRVNSDDCLLISAGEITDSRRFGLYLNFSQARQLADALLHVLAAAEATP
jgi:hypothetical protein